MARSPVIWIKEASCATPGARAVNHFSHKRTSSSRMRYLWIAVARASWSALALCSCVASATAADLLIENVTIVSPDQAAPMAKRHVLIRDGRIASVSAQPISAPAARRIDGRARFLTPGLMDSHVHVSDAPGLPFTQGEPTIDALRAAFQRQQPRSYLYFGVTQLLDPSNEPSGIAAFEAQPQRPDLIRCGAAPALDGYPTVFFDRAVRYRILPTFIFEQANATAHPLLDGERAEDHTPESVVARIAASGARCVKVFIEDGFGDRTDWPMLSTDTLRRVREEARKRGLLLMAHANALGMQRIALDVPVDVLAHGLWNWDEFAGQAGIPPAIADHLRAIWAKRIGYQPTLRVLYGTADLFREDTLKDPVYAKVVPPRLLEWYATPAGQWFREQMKKEAGGAPDAKIMQSQLIVAERGMRAAKFLNDLGAPLLLGSDTPSSPTFGNQPGYDTFREMRAMAQAGIPLLAIFRAATVNNAQQFGIDKDYGTVAAGKIANLLLLESNPLETIRAWSQIDKIILHGEVIERASLAADR
jgi:imidazolonepropionase-like amidohydrolase